MTSKSISGLAFPFEYLKQRLRVKINLWNGTLSYKSISPGYSIEWKGIHTGTIELLNNHLKLNRETALRDSLALNNFNAKLGLECSAWHLKTFPAICKSSLARRGSPCVRRTPLSMRKEMKPSEIIRLLKNYFQPPEISWFYETSEKSLRRKNTHSVSIHSCKSSWTSLDWRRNTTSLVPSFKNSSGTKRRFWRMSIRPLVDRKRELRSTGNPVENKQNNDWDDAGKIENNASRNRWRNDGFAAESRFDFRSLVVQEWPNKRLNRGWNRTILAKDWR